MWWIVIIIIILLLIIVIPIPIYFTNIRPSIKFQVPPSLTLLKSHPQNFQNSKNLKGKDLLEKFAEKLNNIAHKVTKQNQINIITMPSFFNCNEQWPGCLPRALFQGNCGSCWGFASVTCLSSRFYIESCGSSGCQNYPQVNAGSLNDVLSNLNQNYGFRKIFLNIICYSIIKTQITFMFREQT